MPAKSNINFKVKTAEGSTTFNTVRAERSSVFAAKSKYE